MPAVKFLIIRLSSIGDIVLTTPVVRCLSQQIEGAEIHYLVKKSFAPALANNPYIHKIHLFDGNLRHCIARLKDEGFHYVIDLHRNLRSFIIKRRLGVISFTFHKLNFRKWLLTQFKINRLPDIHIVDRYLQTLQLFNVVNDGRGLDFFVSPEAGKVVHQLPVDFQSGYIAIVAGAKHSTKQLPVDRLAKLCNTLPLPVVLLGGPDDVPLSQQILSLSTGQVFNGCGQFRLEESAALLQQARAVITHDTGLMHIAAAFRRPIASVWGNTVPAFGMYPYLPGEGSQIFETNGLPCRPCSKIGYTRCPKGHFRCMNDIDPGAISIWARRILSV